MKSLGWLSRRDGRHEAHIDAVAWRTFAVGAAEMHELFVIRPESDLGKRFIETNRMLLAKLPSDHAHSKKIAYSSEAIAKSSTEFALAQKQEVEELVSELGDAVRETLQKLAGSVDSAGKSIGGLQEVETSLKKAQQADSLEETKRLLSSGVTGLQRVVEEHVAREKALRAEYDEHAKRLGAKLDQAQREGRTDPLTGLGNRRAFEEHAATLLRQAKADSKPKALAMLDLDGFKALNDTFGHAAGDAALTAFAIRLRGAVGEQPFLARLGGDEFVVLANLRPQAVLGMLTTLRENLAARPVFHEGIPLALSVSYGVAPIDGNAPMNEIMRAADAALYESKAASRRAKAA